MKGTRSPPRSLAVAEGDRDHRDPSHLVHCLSEATEQKSTGRSKKQKHTQHPESAKDSGPVVPVVGYVV